MGQITTGGKPVVCRTAGSCRNGWEIAGSCFPHGKYSTGALFAVHAFVQTFVEESEAFCVAISSNHNSGDFMDYIRFDVNSGDAYRSLY